jgi:sphingomyelin phosphodiesterase
VWHQAQHNQTRPTKIITEQIQEHLGHIPLYPIYGNHEAFPADQYDMWGTTTQWLKNEVADMWTGILGDEEISHLRTHGFYSSYNTKHNLRVIAINTQACDSLNFFLMENITDPANELAWLKTQLQDAETNN